MNRYIQDLRKKIDLPYDARIILSIEAGGLYLQCLSAHKDWLMEQSLAVKLRYSVEEIMFEKEDDDGKLKNSYTKKQFFRKICLNTFFLSYSQVVKMQVSRHY